MKYKIILVIIVIFPLFNVLAQGNLGQSGFNFLQVAVEPRGAALGGAVIANTRGADALYWNPAGAVNVENFDLVLSHTDWFIDTELAYAGLVKNIEGVGAFGFSVTSFYMDKLEINTEYQPEGTGEYYESGNISMGVSYARRLTERFSFGVTAKYVHGYIWNETASQLAVDIGSLYRTDFYNLCIALAVRNFSGKLEYTGEDIDDRLNEEQAANLENNPRLERLTPEFRLPQVFQIGIAFEPIVSELGNVTVFTDADVPSDNTQRVILGFEYAYQNFAFLRGGYRMNYDIGEFSVGAGLQAGLMGVDGRIDYAYTEHGILGGINRFAFGLAF